MNATVRKWAMKRISSGDYLLPSDDLSVYWRLKRYQEDGTLQMGKRGSQGGDYRTIQGTFWSVYRCPASKLMAIVNKGEDPFDIEHWDDWESYSFLHQTREEAIQQTRVTE